MAKRDEEEYVYAGNPKEPGSMRRFPAKPGFTDYVKEAFEDTATRASLDAIRKRRSAAR